VRCPLRCETVDGHRYADEPEPSWYTGQSPTPNSYDSGVHERPSGAFRLPEQRPADGYGASAPYPAPDPVTSTGSHALPPQDTGARIPIRGPEYPTIRPSGGGTSLADAPAPGSSAPTTYGGPATLYGGPAGPTPVGPASAVPSQGLLSNGPAPAAQPTTVVPPLARFGAGPESVYRTRRPASAVAIAVVAVLLMIPVILLLVQVTFVDDPAVRGIVPAVLLALGLPLTGFGLYRLAAGGAPAGRDTWLRPPIAYLPVGLLLLLAAGLAVA
jgi:hypothetical protein